MRTTNKSAAQANNSTLATSAPKRKNIILHHTSIGALALIATLYLFGEPLCSDDDAWAISFIAHKTFAFALFGFAFLIDRYWDKMSCNR